MKAKAMKAKARTVAGVAGAKKTGTCSNPQKQKGLRI